MTSRIRALGLLLLLLLLLQPTTSDDSTFVSTCWAAPPFPRPPPHGASSKGAALVAIVVSNTLDLPALLSVDGAAPRLLVPPRCSRLVLLPGGTAVRARPLRQTWDETCVANLASLATAVSVEPGVTLEPLAADFCVVTPEEGASSTHYVLEGNCEPMPTPPATYPAPAFLDFAFTLGAGHAGGGRARGAFTLKRGVPPIAAPGAFPATIPPPVIAIESRLSTWASPLLIRLALNQRVPCPVCNHEGNDTVLEGPHVHMPLLPCAACGGVGTVSVSGGTWLRRHSGCAAHGNASACGGVDAEGDGEVTSEQRATLVCPLCKGVGALPDPAGPPCTHCGGERFVDEEGRMFTVSLPAGVPSDYRLAPRGTASGGNVEIRLAATLPDADAGGEGPADAAAAALMAARGAPLLSAFRRLAVPHAALVRDPAAAAANDSVPPSPVEVLRLLGGPGSWVGRDAGRGPHLVATLTLSLGHAAGGFSLPLGSRLPLNESWGLSRHSAHLPLLPLDVLVFPGRGLPLLAPDAACHWSGSDACAGVIGVPRAPPPEDEPPCNVRRGTFDIAANCSAHIKVPWQAAWRAHAFACEAARPLSRHARALARAKEAAEAKRKRAAAAADLEELRGDALEFSDDVDLLAAIAAIVAEGGGAAAHEATPAVPIAGPRAGALSLSAWSLSTHPTAELVSREQQLGAPPPVGGRVQVLCAAWGDDERLARVERYPHGALVLQVRVIGGVQQQLAQGGRGSSANATERDAIGEDAELSTLIKALHALGRVS